MVVHGRLNFTVLRHESRFIGFFTKGFLHDTRRTCSVATAPSNITSHPSDDIHEAWIGRDKYRLSVLAVQQIGHRLTASTHIDASGGPTRGCNARVATGPATTTAIVK